MTVYDCCEHCDHDDSGLPPDQHTRPCEYGCNDNDDKGGARCEDECGCQKYDEVSGAQQ